MIREAVNRAETYAFGPISNVQAELKEVMREIAKDRGKVNRRRLGKWIARDQGRIVDGLRFEKASGTTVGGEIGYVGFGWAGWGKWHES